MNAKWLDQWIELDFASVLLRSGDDHVVMLEAILCGRVEIDGVEYNTERVLEQAHPEIGIPPSFWERPEVRNLSVRDMTGDAERWFEAEEMVA